MSDARFALFDTAIGWCALAWTAGGVVRAWLPEADARALRARIARRLPTAEEAEPPPDNVRAIAAIRALLAGEPEDLGFVPLDLTRVPPFDRKVYAVARAIPPGATLTYGDVASRIGAPGEARAVGQALGRNPVPIIVPCHRVVAAGERLGGFSAPGGVETKLRLLAIEGAVRQLPLFAFP